MNMGNLGDLDLSFVAFHYISCLRTRPGVKPLQLPSECNDSRMRFVLLIAEPAIYVKVTSQDVCGSGRGRPACGHRVWHDNS